MIEVKETSSTEAKVEHVIARHKCDTCRNKTICKYAEEFEEALKILTEVKVPDPVVVEMNCTAFQTMMGTRTSIR